MAKNKKVIKYRRNYDKVIAVVTFVLIAVYVVCFVFLYATKSSVKTYETALGSLYDSESFTALAIRDETVYYSNYSGFVNYYQVEGSKVANGETVYSVDETGKVADLLASYSTDTSNALSSDDLSLLKETLDKYKLNYDPNEFSEIYNLKTDLNSTILASISADIMENLDSLIDSTGNANFFNAVGSEAAGVVVYSTDGYENFSEDQLSTSCFNKNNYGKNVLKNTSGEDTIAAGDAAYKIVNSENWNLYISLSKSQVEQLDLTNASTVTVNFKSDGISTSCGFELVEVNGQYFGKMSLSKYMIRYATERYLDIELVVDEATGIKVPSSAMTTKDFYVLPTSYLTSSGNENGYLISYEENGETKKTFIKVARYYTEDNDTTDTSDDYIYVDPNLFPSDSFVLIKEDSKETYSDIKTASLNGVYCVNSGFTEFKVGNILKKNDEYCILENNATKGVELYDRILLDAKKYSEGELIY